MRLFNLFPWPRIGIMHTNAATKESLHTLFGHWHTWFGYALYGLLALHVLGALKHQLLDKAAGAAAHAALGQVAPAAGQFGPLSPRSARGSVRLTASRYSAPLSCYGGC